MWDPNAETAVGINMFFDLSTRWFYSLIIGAESQTKVQLYYVGKSPGDSTKDSQLLKEKLIPKIIPSGYWQGFWLVVPDRGIELGFEGSETPIFSWSSKEKLSTMIYNRTAFISFHTFNKRAIGLNFPSSCQYPLSGDDIQ